MIKTWQESYTRGDVPNVELRIDLMQREINELRASNLDLVYQFDALRVDHLTLKKQEPVTHEYLSKDGKWRGFMDEAHYKNTVRDGWPVRALYLAAGAQP